MILLAGNALMFSALAESAKGFAAAFTALPEMFTGLAKSARAFSIVLIALAEIVIAFAVMF